MSAFSTLPPPLILWTINCCYTPVGWRGATVRATWYRTGLVQVVPVRQNVIGRVWRQQITYCLHFLLGASKLSVGSAAVHCVHGGPCGHCNVAQRGVFLHAFADDTQMYLHCHHDDLQSAATQLKLCISEVGQWMTSNRLKLNTELTELIWTGSKASLLRQGRCLPAP